MTPRARKTVERRENHFNRASPEYQNTIGQVKWLLNLQRQLNALSTSARVSISRARLMQMTLLIRLTVRAIEAIDRNDMPQAKLHLEEFVGTLLRDTLPHRGKKEGPEGP